MSYCNSDLKRYYANIDEFDLKKTLADEWVNISDEIYRYYDSGSVSKLYKNGRDLGDPQVNEAAVNTAGEWFYDAVNDYIVIKGTGTDTPNDNEFQVAALDWPDAKSNAIIDAATILDGMLDMRFPRPLPKNPDGNYDYILDRINGLMACEILIASTDPGNAELEAIRTQYTNTERTGLLDLLNDGKIALGFEITRDGGSLSVKAIDASTTGYIEDLRGNPGVLYDKYTITIETGGTLATGAVSSATYKVIDSQGSEVVSETLIDGYYQDLGGGLVGRFVPGVYVADDAWYLTVRGVRRETSTTGKIRVVRV